MNKNRILLIIDRISCHLLFIFILLYIATGYSMTGKYGFHFRLGRKFHLSFCIVLIILFLVHVAISIYFAVMRLKAMPFSQIFSLSARNLNRIIGWILIFLLLIQLIVGFALIDKYRMARLISISNARIIHSVTIPVLIVLFLIHSAFSFWFIYKTNKNK